jgi:spore germination protein YaaH
VRKPHHALLLAAALLTTVFPIPRALAADAPPRKIVSGWAPYWATTASTATITANADLMGDISPFWFSVTSSSRVLDQYTPSNSIPMATQVSALHSSGVQVIPSFTDGTGKLVLAGILADPIKSATLISMLTTMAVLNNFDGIDLDWEGFAFVDGSSSWLTTQPNWTRFVTQLAASLHQQGKVLSVTTPEIRDPATGKRGYWVYDWAGIATSIDRLRIMTYDYSVSVAGPIGPITWVETTARYAASLVPASKSWIGVPAYGRDWVVAVMGTCPTLGADGKPLGINIKAPKNGVSGTRATFVSKDAQTLAASYGATPTWNATYGENTFTYLKTYVGTNAAGIPASCTAQRTAWYQDPRAVQARAALVGKYRLGGIAFWSFGSEDPATWAQLRSYAKTIAPDAVIGTLALSQSPVGFSAPSLISATFRISDSTPVAGVPILFQTLKGGDTNWRDIGTSSTTANGVAQLALVGSQNLQVRALSQGTWQRLAATTTPQQLKVSRLLSVQPSASVRRNSPLVVTGSLWPADSGIGVALQTKTLGQWSNIATATSTDGGAYLLTATNQGPGLFLYRVVVSADARFDQVFSTPFTELIR